MRALLTTVAIATTTTVIAQQQVIVNNPDVINDNNNLQQQRRSLLSRNHNQAITQKATHKGYEKEQRRLNMERRTSTTASSTTTAVGSGSNNDNEDTNKTGVKRTSRHAGTNGEGISRGSGGRRRGGRDKESVAAEESNTEEEKVKGTPKRGENKESSTTLAAAEEVIEDEKIILESLSEQVEQSSSTRQEEEESTNNNKLQQHSINKLPNIAGGLYNNAGISVTDRIKKIYTGNKDDGGSKGGNEIPYDNTNSKSKWNSPMPSNTYSPSPSTTDTSTTMEPTWEGDDWKTPKPTTWNNDDDWTKGSSWMTKGSTMKSKHSSSDSKSKKTTPTKKSSSTSWASWDDNTPPPTPWGDSSWDHPSWENDDDMYPSWGDDDMWSTKSNKSHKTHKTNKSSTKERTISVCTKRLITAFAQMEEFNGSNMPFEGINKPSDVTKHCSFMPPMNEEHINYGCPFIYDPNNPMANEPTGYGFVEGEKEYQMYWKKILGEDSEPVQRFATAYNNMAQYCQCYQGYDMGCASRIPHGPPTQETKYMNDRVATANGYSEYLKPDGTTSERAEYCKLVGVWNGDFLTDVVQDFTEDVQECGCYWIGVAKDMVGSCPGVELGAWYKFPPLPDPTPSPSPPPTSSPTPDETIFEIVEDDDDLSTLEAALEATGLDEVLDGDGPFTLFAPTNEAFAKLDPDVLASLLEPENNDQLTAILLYHVVLGRALSSDLSNGQDIETVNGKDVHVTISDGGVMINQANVIDPDILARNGVIHKIDEVLLPPEITLVDSFEPDETEFPNGPWEVDNHNGMSFERTDAQAYEGDWSVVTPDICDASSTNDDFSYITLNINPEWGPGKLTYYVNSKDLNYPADALLLFVNDEVNITQGWVGILENDGPGDWNKYTLDLQNGRSTGPQGIMSASPEVNKVSWHYQCKPNGSTEAKPGGRAYIDYITFTPSNEDMEMIDISPPKHWTYPDP